MLQNPRQYPRRHALLLVRRCPARPGWMPVGRRQRGPATRARVGQAPINARKASPTMMRAITGSQLRDDACRRWGRAPHRRSSTRSDLAQCSRSGGIFSHGSNAPKRVEYSRSGVVLPTGRILSEERRREHASPTTPPSTMPGTEPRPTPFVLSPSHARRVVSVYGAGLRPGRRYRPRAGRRWRRRCR